MSNTAALDGQYSKIIPSRFVTTKSGAPLPCICCGETLVLGQAYAALTAAGKWVSFCSQCASNYPTQAARLYKAMCERVKSTPGATESSDVKGGMIGAVSHLQALVQTPNDLDTFKAAKAGLFAVGRVLDGLGQAATAAALAEDDNYVGLAHYIQFGPERDREFAQSLLTQWERKGDLSPKQMVYVVKFATKGNAAALAAAPDPDLPVGLYLCENKVTRIYLRSHRLLARTYDGTTFQVERNGVRRVYEAVIDGRAHLMTTEEAHAYGVQHGRCFNCMAMGRPGVLSDDRSLAAGYGADCASTNGWHYPTAAEAAAILRPTV